MELNKKKKIQTPGNTNIRRHSTNDGTDKDILGPAELPYLFLPARIYFELDISSHPPREKKKRKKKKKKIPPPSAMSSVRTRPLAARLCADLHAQSRSRLPRTAVRRKSGPYGYTQAKALVYSKNGEPSDVLG
jgi:hypothetical protein